MFGKVNRIFLKTIGVLFILLVVLSVGFYFAVQSYAFQTWLGHRVSSYLSSELETTVNIQKIEIDFFRKAHLKNMLLKDQNGDTLYAGNISVDVKTFDWKKKKIYLSSISLVNVTSKIIKSEKNQQFNFQFITDYFKGDTIASQKKSDWDFKLEAIRLKNISFQYHDLADTIKLNRNINFNHVVLKEVNGSLSNISLTEDSIKVSIFNLQAKESSGFGFSNLTTEAFVSKNKLSCDKLTLKTDDSFIRGNINFSFQNWDDFKEFNTQVRFKSKFEDSTKINFKDIAYFALPLNDFNESIEISGNIEGTVSDLNLKKIKLKYRDYTQFNGYLSIIGLPDVSNSYLHFDAKRLSTNYEDLINFPLAPFSENKKLQLPIEIKKLGTVSYKGKFDGLLKDFTTYGEFKTALGNVTSELSIQLDEKKDNIKYKGNLSTEDFYLGELLGLNDFNALSMRFELKGQGLDLNSINSEFKGIINNINFQNYNYKKIKIDGSLNEKMFNGLFSCLDTNANFDFNGSIDFKNKVPEMYFISSINRLNLNKLHLTNLIDSGEFSTQMFININGDNIDNLSGQINFDNSVYKTKSKNYKLNRFNIDLNQSSENKSIILKSAYFNSSLSGKYKIGNMKSLFETILSDYYPDYFTKPKQNKTHDENFTFTLDLKKFETIRDLFIPSLMISSGSRLRANVNATDQKINIEFYSDLITYQLFKFNAFSLNIGAKEKTVLSHIQSKSVYAGDSVNIENFNVNINSQNITNNYSIDWDNHKTVRSNAKILGTVMINKNGSILLQNDSINICVNDSVWTLEKSNLISFVDKIAQIEPLILKRNNQKIEIKGIYSDKQGDSLNINANELILAQFNPLLKLINLKVEGEMNGHVSMAHPNNHFAFNGDLNLQKLKVNDNIVGELALHSHYNTEENYVNINGYTSLGLQDEFGNQIKNVSFSGNYFLDNRPEAIDVNLNANPANIKLLNPILEGILTIKNGYVNGNVRLHGSSNNLKIDGKLRLYNSEVKVDYTNVVYNVSGDIEIMPDQIRFSDLLMREKGTKSAPQGTVNGNIFHNNFKKMQLDYDISYKNMLVLNTTEKENKTFYGKIYSTGNVGIYGYVNNLKMQIFDTVTKNSRFIMPLDGPNEIEDDDFVHFVKRDTTKEKKEISFGGFNLDLNIYATPACSVQIILDKQNGDMLNAQGQGNINLKINTLGKFDMTGEYMITNGDYLFTLEHLINKKFDIEAGSSITWNGDPLNAEIDVATSYKQRASVAPLLNDTSGEYKGRFAVDCKLFLTGKLFSPNISFAFDFPNLDATPRAKISSVLSDEAELNRQVFSFLLFRNFVTPQIFNTNGGGVTAGSAAASTSSELLSNRISGFLNSYFGGLTGLKDLNLGLNYRPGNQNSKESVDLALSKQFLNNKISVDGNFGVNNTQTSQSSNFIGDVNIDYKLTDDGRYRLTGFNRTNNSTQLATTGGQYTQGVGLFYRREFNSFKDFLNRNKTAQTTKK